MLLLGLAKQTDADAYASTYNKREYHIYHNKVVDSYTSYKQLATACDCTVRVRCTLNLISLLQNGPPAVNLIGAGSMCMCNERTSGFES